MEAKLYRMELILIGRHALPKILDKADLVREMKRRKHYFEKGVPDRISTERESGLPLFSPVPLESIHGKFKA